MVKILFVLSNIYEYKHCTWCLHIFSFSSCSLFACVCAYFCTKMEHFGNTFDCIKTEWYLENIFKWKSRTISILFHVNYNKNIKMPSSNVGAVQNSRLWITNFIAMVGFAVVHTSVRAWSASYRLDLAECLSLFLFFSSSFFFFIRFTSGCFYTCSSRVESLFIHSYSSVSYMYYYIFEQRRRKKQNQNYFANPSYLFFWSFCHQLYSWTANNFAGISFKIYIEFFCLTWFYFNRKTSRFKLCCISFHATIVIFFQFSKLKIVNKKKTLLIVNQIDSTVKAK